MKTINIVAGDTVKCTNCGREIAMTAEFLLTLRDEHFPSRVNPDLYVADLERFKCKTCGRQELEFVPSGSSRPAMFAAYPGAGTVLCRLCGGDGGAGGRCSRCGGNGLEQN